MFLTGLGIAYLKVSVIYERKSTIALGASNLIE